MRDADKEVNKYNKDKNIGESEKLPPIFIIAHYCFSEDAAIKIDSNSKHTPLY